MIELAAYRPDTVYTIYIAATPEKVWQALTTAGFSRQYFFGFAFAMEARAGGSFSVRAPDGSVHIDGEVLACDPPRKLSVTWNVNWPGLVEKLGHTIVTYELAQTGDAVRLTMTEAHERELPEDILSGGRTGWPRDSVQPQEPAGNRQTARHQDGAAAADAGGAEEAGGWGAVGCVVPAEAGTHTPCHLILKRKNDRSLFKNIKARGYGSPPSRGRQLPQRP